MQFNKSKGAVSKLLLILAVLVFVVGIVAYLIIAASNKPKSQTEDITDNNQPVVPEPIYEKQLGDIDFIFESAVDLGQILSTANVVSEQYASQASYQKSIQTTTGRFIRVTVGAKNLGKIDTVAGTWGMENIVDSEGRNFIPSKSYQFFPWIPDGSECGAVLKPAFDPVQCSQIYEVSKESTGLKITIQNKKASTSKTDASKSTTESLDIIVR